MIKVPIISFLLSYAEIGSLLLSLAGRQSRTVGHNVRAHLSKICPSYSAAMEGGRMFLIASKL